MNSLIKSISLFFVVVSAVIAGVDNNPLNNGTTLTRNALGHNFEGAVHNPALLGIERVPNGGLMFPGTMVGVGVWSDKLALSPFNKYVTGSAQETSSLITGILDRSFDLKGLSPDEVSDKLTEKLKGGITMYAGYRESLLNFGYGRIAFDVVTHIDEEAKIPEGPLLMIFSRDKGLRAGNTLDFSSFRQDAVWATDFAVSFGLPVNIPVLHDFFHLKNGAGGIGVKYVMGHSVLKATTKKGKMYWDDEANALDIDGEVTIQTAGCGFSGPWRASNPFEGGLPVSGHGVGIDLGGILYDERGTLTINFQNIGVLLWMNGVKDVTYTIKKDDFDAWDIVHGIEEADKNIDESGDDPNLRIFRRNAYEYISDNNDSLKNGDVFVTWLPASLNIGYAYTWDFSRTAQQPLRLLADYAHAAVNYEQALVRAPGRSFIPRLSIGGEAGTLHGFLPIRLGYVFGGSERIASVVGAGLNFRYVSINGSYKAIGHGFFIPKHGMELAAGLSINWGMSTDQDNDGIPDRVDSCRTTPEDKDGFEDADGCPDYDNDKDGIVDTLDRCPNAAEDNDGFEGTDGCPDYDNDGDGVPDSLDKCPNVPEDRDNFEDADGCPDPDNDNDKVFDRDDRCPNNAEDFDGFEDADGCPDYDNDKDGIPDAVDQCPNQPEVFNGYKDSDGCPDSLIRPSEKEAKALTTKLQSINFKTNSAELISSSFSALDYVAQFLKGFETLRYEIQGHTDNKGSDDNNLLLSAARAGTVRVYLLSKGIPEERLIGIGYGKSMPIADNAIAKGRAQNRRVEFKIIETNNEYNALRAREAEFKVKVLEAKIKGAQ